MTHSKDSCNKFVEQLNSHLIDLKSHSHEDTSSTSEKARIRSTTANNSQSEKNKNAERNISINRIRSCNES